MSLATLFLPRASAKKEIRWRATVANMAGKSVWMTIVSRSQLMAHCFSVCLTEVWQSAFARVGFARVVEDPVGRDVLPLGTVNLHGVFLRRYLRRVRPGSMSRKGTRKAEKEPMAEKKGVGKRNQ